MSFDPSLPIFKSIRHRLKQAIAEPANLIGLTGAIALSAALLNPIPLLIGLVAEAAYLLFVPDSAWFTKRLQSKFDEEVVAHREKLKGEAFPKLRYEIVNKFGTLEAARVQIEASLSSKDQWFREALRKLDFLLEKYLQFGVRESEYLNYLFTLVRENSDHFEEDEIRPLKTTIRALGQSFERPGDMESIILGWSAVSDGELAGVVRMIDRYYEREAASLGEQANNEAIMATSEILNKRKNVLQRRREFIGRLGDTLINLRHQMELIADTFGLINDEIRARSPEQVLADIDEVVMQATTLTDTLDELTPTDQVVSRM